MNKVQQQVTEFHKAGGHVINSLPTLVDSKTISLRRRLISEEAEELFEAMESGDLVLVDDALADLLYVVYGTAVSFGIDMQPISDEVHRSNMTKFSTAGAYETTCDETGKSLKDEGGKTLKPPCYEPPQLAAILVAQMPIVNRDEKIPSQALSNLREVLAERKRLKSLSNEDLVRECVKIEETDLPIVEEMCNRLHPDWSEEEGR